MAIRKSDFFIVIVLYKLINAVCDANEAVNSNLEFLKSLPVPGIIPVLQLKIRPPIRNLNPMRNL